MDVDFPDTVTNRPNLTTPIKKRGEEFPLLPAKGRTTANRHPKQPASSQDGADAGPDLLPAQVHPAPDRDRVVPP
jgi:hypothetical protein